MTNKLLLEEYKETRKWTSHKLSNIREEINEYRYKLGDLTADCPEQLMLREKVCKLEKDREVVASWLSNLDYSIKWLKTGRQPGNTRGIERRAAYEREISVEPYWIQLNKEEDVRLFEIEESVEELDRTANNEAIIKEIMKSLDKKEKAVFELAAKEFSQREIARFLNLKRVTVQKILERCHRKIVEEGWIMI